MLDLFDCICDAIVCDMSEMWLCDVYWFGILVLLGWGFFHCVRSDMGWLISCDSMWISFYFCDACLCLVQMCTSVVCVCVFVFVCVCVYMHVMSDL